MEKRVLIEGIIQITKEKNFSKIEIRQGKENYRLEDIIVKSLGDEISEGYGQIFAGKVDVLIQLQGNSIKTSEGDVFSHKISFSELDMGGKKNEMP